MREKEVIRWLKAQGAVPTPPEMRARLIKAGHHGVPTNEPEVGLAARRADSQG